MEKLEVNELFESMDIEQEQKIALQESFDKAVLKTTTDLMEEFVEKEVAQKVETLEEEYKEKVEGLTESLDGYLDSVVEDFITENAPMYEAQIADEKAATVLEAFDKMAEVLGVDMLRIQEAKDTEDDAEDKDKKLEDKDEKISELAEKLVEAKREADRFMQAGLVQQLSIGLSILEAAKFEKLSEMVAFDRSAAYLEKLETIKESILDNRADDFVAEANLPANAFKQEEVVDSKSAMDFSKYV